MAVGTYLLTLVYKPTALVFSTALGAVALLCLIPVSYTHLMHMPWRTWLIRWNAWI